jgi:NAD(P)-dependent dehydrogenase (short-subunit alcohol dehydrogenase family)
MHPELISLFDLRGQTALITGGARTLGYDASSILAAAGCDIALTSRNLKSAEAAANQLQDIYGVDTLPLELDQTSFDDVADVVRQVLTWKPQLHILVNNAGGAVGESPALLFDRDPKDIELMIATNLTGLLYCCREAGRHMAEKRYGKIINIASIAGLCGRDRRVYARAGMKGQPVDYAAAKAGVIGATMDLAGYLSPSGVFVNAISPGGFERGQPAQFIRDYSDRTALGRMGRDGIDLKGAILFLASPASAYITGQNLTVDGGFTMWK